MSSQWYEYSDGEQINEKTTNFHNNYEPDSNNQSSEVNALKSGQNIH